MYCDGLGLLGQFQLMMQFMRRFLVRFKLSSRRACDLAKIFTTIYTNDVRETGLLRRNELFVAKVAPKYSGLGLKRTHHIIALLFIIYYLIYAQKNIV